MGGRLLDKILAVIFGSIMLIALLLPVFLIIIVIVLIIYSIFTKSSQRPPDVYSANDIEEYMKNNTLVNCIENENIYIQFSDYEEGLYIRCINKLNKTEFFTVTGSSEMLGTCWVVVQKYSYFQNYTYNGLFFWFNERYATSNGQLLLTKNR